MKMSNAKTRVASFALPILLIAATFVASGAVADSRVLTQDGSLASLESNASRLTLQVGDDKIALPGNHGARSEAVQLTTSRFGGLVAVWLRPSGEGHTLEFATWDGDAWSEVGSLLANDSSLVFPTRPHVTVADDYLRLAMENEAGEPETVQLERILFHVVWSEDDGRVRYSSIVFNDGSFVGWNEIVTLSSAFSEMHSESEAKEVPQSLQGTLAVAAEPGGLNVTLTDDLFGRLGTLRIQALPLAMELLGDAILEGVLDNADAFDPDDLSALADEIRAEIVHLGSKVDLDPNVGAFLSDQIGDFVELSGSEFGWDLLALAEATQVEALDLGRSVYSATVVGAGGEVTVINVGDFLDHNGHRDEFSRLIRISVSGDFAAPEDVGDGVQMHVSPDGSALALSWVDEETGAVHWTEGRHGTWSDSKSLATSETTDEAAIRELISESIR